MPRFDVWIVKASSHAALVITGAEGPMKWEGGDIMLQLIADVPFALSLGEHRLIIWSLFAQGGNHEET